MKDSRTSIGADAALADIPTSSNAFYFCWSEWQFHAIH
jgi:hypothetical protein